MEIGNETIEQKVITEKGDNIIKIYNFELFLSDNQQKERNRALWISEEKVYQF